MIGSIRRALQRRLPTAHEVVYEYRDWFVISYTPSGHGFEGVFAIRASAEGVKFYFNRGSQLRDPEKLLQGSGSRARWIAVHKASTLRRPAIVRLIDQAIALNDVPFARTGRGPVTIRSTSAKGRPRRKTSKEPTPP